jgi:pimeloyl-ACP methyl ester carboxylesterase
MKISSVKSADGTSIAFETAGSGPPLILIGGAFCDRKARASGTPLAALLAPHFTVFSYDRRGRGDSGDTKAWAVERELEDLAALLAKAGGSAFVYGISSGALLALAAAAAQLSIPKLALYEPPLLRTAAQVEPMLGLTKELIRASAAGERTRAVELFLGKVMRLPEPALAQMRKSASWLGLEALAHTLSYDLRVTTLGPSLLERASSVRSDTLALYGEACVPWMREAIVSLAHALPNGQERMLAGQTHDVNPEVLAKALTEFFSA